MATKLLRGLPHKKCVDMVIADKGYDSDDIRKEVTQMGATPVIPRKKNSKIGNADLDRESYKSRHTVENTHGWLKKFRALATRYDKLKITYDSTFALASIMMWLKKLL